MSSTRTRQIPLVPPVAARYQIEPFARYEWLQVSSEPKTKQLNILTFGANWYIKKHNAKFTVDLVWALNSVNAPNTLGASLTGLGLLTDGGGHEGQKVLRAQFQLLF